MSEAIDKLKAAVIEGLAEDADSATREALGNNTDPQDLISQAIIPAMQVVGARFEEGEYYLPEMMAAAMAAQECLAQLRPLLAETGVKPRATAILGTVKGDLHDIGKNLVGMMWEGAGFQVIDLGADVPAQKFIDEINKGQAQLVGLSALLTTTMPMMQVIIDEIKSAGVRDRVKIMIGGAAVTGDYAQQIGADGHAPDASSAVRAATELLQL